MCLPRLSDDLSRRHDRSRVVLCACASAFSSRSMGEGYRVAVGACRVLHWRLGILYDCMRMSMVHATDTR